MACASPMPCKTPFPAAILWACDGAGRERPVVGKILQALRVSVTSLQL